MAIEVPASPVTATTAEPYIWLPTQRIFGKQPSASILWRRTQPKPSQELQQKYRVMYYKQHHSVAIRQRLFQKRQVGSTRLSTSMPKDKGIDLAKK
eukprot:2402564-Amphidinium_carterae.1